MISKVKSTDRLLRVDVVAERLGLKPSTIRSWILKRRIAVVRVGPRAVRVAESEVERLIAAGAVPARDERR